jgi:hypothetical protein
MHRLLALILAVGLLAIPSAAFAQSAGDEQYADPFGEVEEGGGSQDEPSGTQDEPAPAPAPEPAPAAEGAPAAEPVAAQADAPTLPATGLPAGLLAGAGALLLTGGAALRRRLS